MPGIGIGIGIGLPFRRGGVKYEEESELLFAAFSSISEPLSNSEKVIYNTTIKALKDNGLWALTDQLQVARQGYENSSFMNWKTATVRGSKQKTAVDYPLFTKNYGFETNGVDNYIDTGFNPTTHGINYTLNNAGVIFRTAKNVANANYSLGAYQASTNRLYLIKEALNVSMKAGINGGLATIVIDDSKLDKKGYYGIFRKNASTIFCTKDEFASADVTNTAATSLINKNIFIGGINGLTGRYPEIWELIWFGACLTQVQVDKFREIMDEFFFMLDTVLAEDVELYGAVGDGVTDDWSAIQTLLNTSTVNAIKIGSSINKTFITSKEILIPSNKTVVGDGIIKLKDGVTVSIVQDLAINATNIYVSSVIGFSVGQLVGWTDDNQQTQGGGVQTRKVGGCGYITSIDTNNNIITVDYGSKYAITVSANARLGHYQNVFKINASSENINIYGDGIIDGNMTTQLDIEGVYNDATGIEFGGSGLFIKQCNRIRIKGRNQLKFTNAILHGIAFLGGTTHQSKNIIIDKVKCYLNHDKNLLFYNTDTSNVANYIGDSSLYEDGLIYYAANSNATARNISCSNNRRAGFYANNNTNLNLTGDYINLSGNKIYDLAIVSNNVTLSHVTINGVSDVNPRYSIWVTSFYGHGDNVIINGLLINNVKNPLYAIVGLQGQINNVDFNNCEINNCSGIGILSNDGELGGLPQDIVFTEGGIYNHTGTKTSIAVGSDITFNDFEGL